MILLGNGVAREPLVEDPLPHQMAQQHQSPRLGIELPQIAQIVILPVSHMNRGKDAWRFRGR